MSFRIVRALATKDFSLFFRNRFYALITALGLVTHIAIYMVMPSTVDETLLIGLYAPGAPPGIESPREGLVIERVESEQALIEAVIEGEYDAGVAMPEDFPDEPGQKPQVTLYFPADAPEELRGAVEFRVTELAYEIAGYPLTVEASVEILGPDTSGEAIPMRDRLIPLFVVALIMFEALGLATLISEEVELDTAQALLVTPASVPDLFTAKGFMGIGLAFSQAALFMAVVGGLGSQPLIILVALLLGAALATGVGFLIASVAKEMMSVMAWGMLAIIVLTIPAFAILFPGAISDWVKVIPSYYLADTLYQAVNFDVGWADLWPNLLILLGFDIAFIWGGIWALRRRLQ